MLRALALAAALLVPVAGAQVGGGGTLAAPVQGAYGDVYVVAGRAIDASGAPVARGAVNVRLEAPGVVAPSLDAGTDCFGVFITYFELRHADPKGRLTVAVRDADGKLVGPATKALDPFFRRSDFDLALPGAWSGGCPDQTHLWDQRVTITGRILNRTEPYVARNETHHARPLDGHVRVRYWPDESGFECPPSSREPGLCDPVPVDERGDFRYSWVFADPRSATGRVEVVREEQAWSFPVDPAFRHAVAMIEASGRGPPPPSAPTPGPPLALALALALTVASLLPGKRARR